MAARQAEGVDVFKLVLEDGRTYGITSPTLDYPTLAALIAAAHDAGLLVVAHAPIQRYARWAIRAGVDVLAHMVVDEPPAADVVAGLAQAGMAVISTLTVFEAAEAHRLWQDARVAAHLSPEGLERLAEPVAETFRPRTQIDHGLAAIRAYHQAGVSILAGTDAPNPGTAPGASLHRELQLLARAGLSATEALPPPPRARLPGLGCPTEAGSRRACDRTCCWWRAPWRRIWMRPSRFGASGSGGLKSRVGRRVLVVSLTTNHRF